MTKPEPLRRVFSPDDKSDEELRSEALRKEELSRYGEEMALSLDDSDSDARVEGFVEGTHHVTTGKYWPNGGGRL